MNQKPQPRISRKPAYEELTEHIRRLVEEEHLTLIEYLRITESMVTHGRVKSFEECDHVISRFLDFQKNLTEHINYENYVIFPKIQRAAQFDNVGMRDIKDRLYKSELVGWIGFHGTVKEELGALRLINDTVESCNLHEATGDYFLEFEGFLREHADFEDEVLFPAAIELAIDDID
ncbi:MAG: hemerythrin domain-containing protein [bacterium]|nr:hemerythrin domain-containing protein [bacterium]